MIQRLCLTLNLMLILWSAQPAWAEESRAGEVMAEAMTRMMDAFGLSGSDAPATPADAANSPLPDAMPMPMPESMPMPGGHDWWGHFGNPIWEFSLPEAAQPLKPLMDPISRAMERWQPTKLSGIWEGRDGGLLIVKGYRFRLYQPTAAHDPGYIDGFIQQRGDRIALYNPVTHSARPYEFALHQGRLALRDAAGSLFLYRRLWLEP
ncbi:hypothetical protein [Rhabdochromatium marinum]|uniref:hypothetical protein n=1 Tax=Rhabdochromatium marinum TaxID=48729 RepID=UPI0019036C47|nr:hypothetical protein [Rhabdochromatium marinum]MBK1650053.1 hypothetical protein [Rhabdochromatium marinum]